MNRSYFLFFLLVYSLQSCVVPQFSEPQPAGVKDKTFFPSKFYGKYYVTLLNMNSKPDKESSVIIDSTHLILYEVKKIRAALSDVKSDSTVMMVDGKIYVPDGPVTKVYPYQLINDSIYYTDTNRVELNLAVNCILREWKGLYFLNRKHEKNWDLLLMDHEKDDSYTLRVLMVSEKKDDDTPIYSDPSEIPIDSFYPKKAPPVTPKPKEGKKKEHLYLEDLEQITAYKKEKDEYVINPSRAQLNKLIRKKFFKEVWRIEKIK